MATAQVQIQANIDLHEAVAFLYDGRHPEIFNSVEQERLRATVESAVRAVTSVSGNQTPHMFDMGCGTGNLTAHFLNAGCTVTSGDLSPSFLEIIKTNYGKTERVDTLLLNGSDLSSIMSNTYDIVGCYSVLHHVPDYLAIVREMIRVLKPGGVLYIDHEASPDYWNQPIVLREYLSQLPKNEIPYHRRLVSGKWWLKRLKKFSNPRYQEEGDIHVWQDDHIDWSEIEQIAWKSKMEIVLKQDTLGFENHHSLEHYHKYKDKCNTVRCFIAKKMA